MSAEAVVRHVTCHLEFPPEWIRVWLTKDGLMKKQRFTEEQIIAVLKEQEAGAKAADRAVGAGFPKQPFTIGRPNAAAWRSLRPGV